MDKQRMGDGEGGRTDVGAGGQGRERCWRMEMCKVFTKY